MLIALGFLTVLSTFLLAYALSWRQRAGLTRGAWLTEKNKRVDAEKNLARLHHRFMNLTMANQALHRQLEGQKKQCIEQRERVVKTALSNVSYIYTALDNKNHSIRLDMEIGKVVCVPLESWLWLGRAIEQSRESA